MADYNSVFASGAEVDQALNKAHTHENIEVLNSVTQNKINIITQASTLSKDNKIYGIKNGEWVEMTNDIVTETEAQVTYSMELGAVSFAEAYLGQNVDYGKAVRTQAIIPIKIGDKIEFPTTCYPSTDYTNFHMYIFFYTKDEACKRYTMLTTNVNSYIVKESDMSCTIDGTEYAITGLRFYITNEATAMSTSKVVTEGEGCILYTTTEERTNPIELIPYISNVNGHLYLYNKDTKEYNKTGLNANVQAIKDNLFGKKWTVIGDSMTEHNEASAKVYHEYIAEWTGVSVTNMGISGTGYMAGVSSSENPINFVQRYANVPTDTDIITVMGSLNDYPSVTTDGALDNSKLGQLGDTTSNTLYGSIYTVLNGLITNFPNKPIGVITTLPSLSYHGTRQKYMPCVDAVIEVAEELGLPVLDLYRHSGLRPWNESHRSAFYDTAGIHPNADGHKVLAQIIYSFIEQYLLW